MNGAEQQPSQFWHHNEDELSEAYYTRSPIDPFHKLEMPFVTLNNQIDTMMTLFCPFNVTKAVTIHDLSTTKLCDQYSKSSIEISPR